MNFARRFALRLCVALFASLSLAACGKGDKLPAHGSDITGTGLHPQIQLSDHNGQPRTLRDFQGKVVVVFFGYTHCPDVCPTTLSDMVAALKALKPEEAQQVQVLFISVDPERDTPAVLKAYVPYFHPDFLGLHGSKRETQATAASFKAFYRRHETQGASGYLIDHTAGSFVFDREGELRLFLPYAQPPKEIAEDLRLLLHAA